MRRSLSLEHAVATPAAPIWSEHLTLHGLAGSMRRWCEEHGQSQGVLAMRVGVSVSHLNRIMHEQARPSAQLAQRILAVIGDGPPRGRISEVER